MGLVVIALSLKGINNNLLARKVRDITWYAKSQKQTDPAASQATGSGHYKENVLSLRQFSQRFFDPSKGFYDIFVGSGIRHADAVRGTKCTAAYASHVAFFE